MWKILVCFSLLCPSLLLHAFPSEKQKRHFVTKDYNGFIDFINNQLLPALNAQNEATVASFTANYSMAAFYNGFQRWSHANFSGFWTSALQGGSNFHITTNAHAGPTTWTPSPGGGSGSVTIDWTKSGKTWEGGFMIIQHGSYPYKILRIVTSPAF